MHETLGEVVSGLAGIGVEVVKNQASNAIQIDELADERVGQAFAELSGSPYLHQVNGVTGDGQPWFRDDLSFADPSIPRSGSARCTTTFRFISTRLRRCAPPHTSWPR